MSSEQNIIVLVHWNGVLTNVDNEVKYSSFPNAVLFLNADVSYSTFCENVLTQISRDGLNEIKTIHGKFPFDTTDGVCASMPWPIHDEPSWTYFVQIASNVYDRLEVFIAATNRDVVIPLLEGPSRRRGRNTVPSTSNQGPSMVQMDPSHEPVEDEDDPDYNNLSFSEEESASEGSDDSHDSSWAVPHNQDDPFVEPAYRVEDPIHVGRIYDSFDELKKAVSIQTLKEYRAFENVSKRPTYWRARCVHPEQCSWHIQAAQVRDTNSWKVKQYQPRHNCIPTYTRAKIDKLLTSKFIASEISTTIRIKPDYSVKLIMNDIHQKYNIHVGYKKAWYARILALEQRFGNWETSYNDLPNVLQAMAYTNPGSIIDIQTDNTNTQGTYEFKFAFWSIKASIDGFNHCLPVVSIDGTHLYGKYKGHLLVAVAMNANREIYPLAFGVVDSENGASWTWFLQLLVTHIIPPARNVCIISDRHAAIDYAFRNVEQLRTPQIQRRYCLRHIRSNFMSQFRSKQLKKLCWRAGSTPIVSEFHHYMQQIRGTNERAFKYLNDIPQEKWALCFDGGCRYGILTTNLSESFNNALKGCRTLPISALVRATFDKLVQLFAQRRTAGMMWQQAGYHFPDNIRKELMERWQQRPHAVVLPHNNYTGIYSVSVENETPVTVNLSRRVCDCGCWRMNGMPCVHAHSVCHYLSCPVDNLIPEVYKLSSYINAHSSDIMPFPNMNEWPQNEFILLPPKYSSRTSRAGRRQETRFPNEMDMRPRRRGGQHD